MMKQKPLQKAQFTDKVLARKKAIGNYIAHWNRRVCQWEHLFSKRKKKNLEERISLDFGLFMTLCLMLNTVYTSTALKVLELYYKIWRL